MPFSIVPSWCKRLNRSGQSSSKALSTKILNELPLQSLQSLAASLRDGALSGGLSRQPLQQLAGSRVNELHQCLNEFAQSGMTTAHMSSLIAAVAAARASTLNTSDLVELVLSGPEVTGIPTSDTASQVRKLIDSATDQVLIVGYAVYQGKQVFKRLATRMDELPELRVTLCLDIARKQSDTSLSEVIVRRFAQDFRERQWPGTRLPDVFYDPRSLSDTGDKRSSLHAKCVLVDRKAALITSANFTEAAQQRNIEVGIVVRQHWLIDRLADYFDGLIVSGQLKPCSFS
jgi:phosphatidylserine/phosphatidylglycerophosphate/cardiolipin synthase-like enzyme